MYPSTLLRSLILSFATLALASPLERRADIDSLKVELSTTSPSVASIKDLKVTAAITNTGPAAIKVLKYGTVFDDKLPTKSFAVSKGGKTVPFTGIKLSVSLSDTDESAFTTIDPGQTVEVTHDISSLYDFASVGTGSFTLEPLKDFLVVDSTGRYIEAGQGYSRIPTESVSSNSLTVAVTEDVAKPDATPEKRAGNICTNASRKSFIDTSYTEAKALASGGSSYVSSRGASDALYRSYWGSNPTSRVTSVLNGVAGENSSSRTLSCTDTYGACSSGVIAYTVIATTNIYFCNIFFNEVASSSLCSGTTVASRNVRGGTTLHEITHAVSGTDDVTYGCAADQALPDARKIVNADNYNCFTTQVYANTRC